MWLCFQSETKFGEVTLVRWLWFDYIIFVLIGLSSYKVWFGLVHSARGQIFFNTVRHNGMLIVISSLVSIHSSFIFPCLATVFEIHCTSSASWSFVLVNSLHSFTPLVLKAWLNIPVISCVYFCLISNHIQLHCCECLLGFAAQFYHTTSSTVLTMAILLQFLPYHFY